MVTHKTTKGDSDTAGLGFKLDEQEKHGHSTTWLRAHCGKPIREGTYPKSATHILKRAHRTQMPSVNLHNFLGSGHTGSQHLNASGVGRLQFARLALITCRH